MNNTSSLTKRELDDIVKSLESKCAVINLSKEGLFRERKAVTEYLPTLQSESNENCIEFKPLKVNDGCIGGGYIPRGFAKDLQNRLDDASIKYSENDIDLAQAIISLMATAEDGAHQYINLADDTLVEVKPIAAKVLQRMSRRYSVVMKWLTTPSNDGHEPFLYYKEYSNCSASARRNGSCHDSAKGHSRLYYLSPPLQKRSKQYVTFKKRYRISDGITGIPGDTLSKYVLASFPHISLPTLAQVKAKAAELHGKTMKTSSGVRLAIYLKEDHKGAAYWAERDAKAKAKGKTRIRILDDDIAIYENMLHNGITPPHTSPKCPRSFNSITGLRSWIRDMILVDGKQTVGLDFKALHPALMYHCLKDRLPQNERQFFENTLACDPITGLYGDIHGGVARYIVAHCDDVDLKKAYPTIAKLAKEAAKANDVASVRKMVKKDHLSYYNTLSSRMPYYAVNFVYEREMPEFVAAIKELKRSSDEHYATSNILFRMEVDVMRYIADSFYVHEIFAVYAYDCFYVARSCAEEARLIMAEAAARFGLLTYAEAG